MSGDVLARGWTERVGREVAFAGFPAGLEGTKVAWIENGTLLSRRCEGGPLRPGEFPDFRDRLTEKAGEMWVEDVAREVYGRGQSRVEFSFELGLVYIVVEAREVERNPVHLEFDATRLAEAALATVKAMRET